MCPILSYTCGVSYTLFQVKLETSFAMTSPHFEHKFKIEQPTKKPKLEESDYEEMKPKLEHELKPETFHSKEEHGPEFGKVDPKLEHESKLEKGDPKLELESHLEKEDPKPELEPDTEVSTLNVSSTAYFQLV